MRNINMSMVAKATALALALASSACASTKKEVDTSIPRSQPPAAEVCVSCDSVSVEPTEAKSESEGFPAWLAGFRVRLGQSGARPETVASMLDGLEPDDRIIERDQSQPEFVRPIWSYLQIAASDLRISNGQSAYASRRKTIDAIAGHYGVRAEILLAVWGLESAYGATTGDNDVVRSLATLAWEGRRRGWAEGQLIAAAQMIDRGFATRDQLTGSWAGAMGQTQFIPTTYLEWSADWDGDGRRNIWTDEFDALASAANLLRGAGWQAGAPVVVEVRLPEAFKLDQWDPERSLLVSEWAKLGVRLAGNAPWAAADLKRAARLELPAGRAGPGFLTFPNFRVIKRYNNSTSYALGVAHLAERIAGGGPIAGPWPEGNVPLTRSQTLELQAALNALGHDSGQPDGLAGPNTRRALRDFQRANQLDADGYVGISAYDAVMAAGGRK
ncbi:MAG: lytic murein transglycosylase [Gammaproteobacteria bacterium]|nr:lytic murein transglycosylase [Gammaproteobacteria bacterium]MBU1732489.1 lytic murein transglycosylase [Gammaproteobacteria bacterium]MBU1891772.1 lytic murein transglycosylase [Gammaproteobacteria bacterium]